MGTMIYGVGWPDQEQHQNQSDSNKLGLQIIVQKGKGSLPVIRAIQRETISHLFDKSAIFLTPTHIHLALPL